MDDSHDKTGGRLGPYHLDMRYQDSDEPGGQLYAAHHIDTGRPALVLVPEPGDTWTPRSDWTARVTSHTSPPFLATELEQAPLARAWAIGAVNLAFIRLAGAYTCIEEQPETNAAFTQLPKPPSRPSHGGWLPREPYVKAAALAAGVLVLAAVALWLRLPGSPEWVVSAASADRVVVILIDHQGVPSAVGYPMPDTAFPEQMTPPCSGTQVELRGGCWMTLEQRTPCDKDTAEYESKCYVPVQKKKPEPRTLKH